MQILYGLLCRTYSITHYGDGLKGGACTLITPPSQHISLNILFLLIH